MEPLFTRYQRDLPHWRLTGATYFVTWRLASGQVELSELERYLVARAILHFDTVRYEMFAWVVMNDHVHVLLKPSGQNELRQILHSWKSFTARSFQRDQGRTGRVWQSESFDRIIRDEEELLKTAHYILGKPAKRWPERMSYEWVGSNAIL